MATHEKRLITLSRYISLLIVVCILPLVVLLAYQGYLHMETLKDQRFAEAKNLVGNAMARIDHHLGAQISILKMLSVSPVIDDAKRWPELYDIAKTFREGFGGHIIISDLDFQMLFNSRSPLGSKLPKLPTPKGHAAAPEVLATRKPSVGDSFMGPIANQRLITAIVPVLRNGDLKYLLLATIETAQFQDLVDAINLPSGWTLVLKDSAGETIALRGQENQENLRFETPSNASHWKLALEIPRADLTAASNREALLLVFVIALTVAFGYGFGVLYGKKLRHSVQAVSIKSEKPSQEIGIAELEAVKDELRDIATKGEEAEEALKEREAMYRILVDQASDSLVVHDGAGRILEVNQQACRALGYGKDELLTLSMADIEESFDKGEATARWASIQPQVPYSHISALRRKDGSAFRAELSYGCAIWKGGKVFLVLARDVSERLEYEEALERKVEERTCRLQEANEGLEAFSYSVSHDLKAPLRAINGYLAILESDYSGSILPEAKRYCDAVSRNARSMGVLIDDMLAFSRISRQTVEKTDVDMEALAKEIFQELWENGGSKDVSFQVGLLHPCKDDAAMLRQVWANLLSNALKYGAGAASGKPEIRVDSRLEGDRIVYSVRDNGAGFDMQYRDKLFGVFQRLHPASEYEGTGIGLAIVRQIAQKHGGSVDAWGEEGKGAVFSFSLPKD